MSDYPYFGPVAENVYHNLPAVSSTLLREFADPETGPSSALARFTSTAEETDALRIGRLIHLLLLEPERAAEVVVAPKRSTAAARRAEAQATLWGYERKRRLVVSQAEHEACSGAARAVADAIRPFIEIADMKWAEASCVWTYGGLAHKARPDLLLRAGDRFICIDAKSTSRGISRWRRDAVRNRLTLQAAHYVEGIAQCLLGESTDAYSWGDIDASIWWMFAAVEVQSPHRVRLYKLPSEALRVALDRRAELVADLARRFAENDWADKNDGLVLDLCDADECRRSLGMSIYEEVRGGDNHF